MEWTNIIFTALLSGGMIAGIIWAFKNDHLSTDMLTDLFQLGALKDTLINIFSRPKFVFIYIIFILLPTWVVVNYIRIYEVPLYHKIIISIAGIWLCDKVATKLDVD